SGETVPCRRRLSSGHDAVRTALLRGGHRLSRLLDRKMRLRGRLYAMWERVLQGHLHRSGEQLLLRGRSDTVRYGLLPEGRQLLRRRDGYLRLPVGDDSV